jgi:hypothetical protein
MARGSGAKGKEEEMNLKNESAKDRKSPYFLTCAPIVFRLDSRD